MQVINIDDTEDEFYSFYVENSTRLIYEVQLFDDFVMYRPASPFFRDVIRKLSKSEFLANFRECEGDVQEIKNILTGNIPWDESPISVIG